MASQATGGMTPDLTLRTKIAAAMVCLIGQLDTGLSDRDKVGSGANVADWTQWPDHYNISIVLQLFHLMVIALRRFPSAVRPEGDFRALLVEPTLDEDLAPGTYAGHRGQPHPKRATFDAPGKDPATAQFEWVQACDETSMTNGLNDGLVQVFESVLPDFVKNGFKHPSTGTETVTVWQILAAAGEQAAPVTIHDALNLIGQLNLDGHDWTSTSATLSASLSAIDQVILRAVQHCLPVHYGTLILTVCGTLTTVPAAYDKRHLMSKFADNWCRIKHKIGTTDWDKFTEHHWNDFKTSVSAVDRQRVELMRTQLPASAAGYPAPATPRPAASANAAQELLDAIDAFDALDEFDSGSLAPSLAPSVANSASTLSRGSSESMWTDKLTSFDDAMSAIADKHIARIKSATDGAPHTRTYEPFVPRDNLTPAEQPCKNRRRLGVGLPCRCGGTADPTKGCDAASKFTGRRSGLVKAALAHSSNK